MWSQEDPRESRATIPLRRFRSCGIKTVALEAMLRPTNSPRWVEARRAAVSRHPRRRVERHARDDHAIHARTVSSSVGLS
jgi:hypothetical protein